ncbi:MAG TPA: hypothetical protein VM241_05435 [Candidatus Thermoplasmatota archaeon]|nr:hypothetical protein [Candidatus Thermoplasmatota archaeon]
MRIAASLALASLALAPLALANHVQTDSGNPIVFRSQGGNEWWVQVQISGQGAGSVANMEAADYAGPWVPMAKHYEWGFGVWSASFHIDPTNPVKFRATWSGGAQQESCWFSHPAGVEGCSVSPPPPPGPTWTPTLVGDAGRSHGDTDISIGRPAGRAGNEVYVPAPTGLYAFAWTSSGWARTLVAPGNFDHVAIGDLEGDGVEVVGSTYDFTTGAASVDSYRWDGAQWLSRHLLSLTDEVGGLSYGDVADGGRPELYVATGNPRTAGNGVGYDLYQVVWNGAAHSVARVATSGAPTFPGSIGSLWAGDGDNDGDQELYLGSDDYATSNDRVYVVDAVGGGWMVQMVAFPNTGGYVEAVVVGDPDHNGANEIYALVSDVNAQGSIWQVTHSGGGSVAARIVLFSSDALPNDLFYADGDNDGTTELYATAGNGHLYQVRWTGSGWAPRDVADVAGVGGNDDWLGSLAVGDGDNDGKREAYALGFNFGTCCPSHNVYRIGTSQAPLPPPPGFDATFTAVRGNEWWEQASVSASGGALAKVDIRLNGGAWQPMAKQSWGGWAASSRAVQGTVVQMRATSASGATDLSDCYRWIPPTNTDAAKVACSGSPPPPPPPGFDATFSGVQGNEWWVQASVGGNQPIAGVDARVNCGTWVALAKQSWGGWAKSFHVSPGAKVDFRATSTGGATDLSGGYTWPSATPTSAC